MQSTKDPQELQGFWEHVCYLIWLIGPRTKCFKCKSSNVHVGNVVPGRVMGCIKTAVAQMTCAHCGFQWTDEPL